MEKKYHKRCQECGRTIFGRADKRFCNDTCRSAHSNRKYREANKNMLAINRILKKNHLILHNILSEGRDRCPTKELYYKGFNFDYFTSVKDGPTAITCCYDIGYRTDGETTLINR